MSLRNFLYGICILFTVSACATLKTSPISEHRIKLSEDSLALLNGTYSRTSLTKFNTATGDLFWNFYTRGYAIESDSLYAVTIEVLDATHINVSLFENDRMLRSKTLRGKLKNGYFEMRLRKFILPAVYLNCCRSTKFRIGLQENMHLITDYEQISWGTGFVLIPFYNKETAFNIEYERIAELPFP